MQDAKYFENLHSRVIGVLGHALMLILEGQKELTKESLTEVVRNNFAGDDYHLAVDVVLDLLSQHKANQRNL
ncbi:hypothetical protein PRCB_17690 [Pantoea rodasii]|uniref:Uncharacterized protein n=1 Tax=Pantoea rodasii TaxID=1076549 RepID=A0A2M9W9F3_9GAMM|nr:hypothetical protein [Pantoea rodasii]ORM63994.1 hypothetical protein HA45_12840 [Pantoea rodasii]PJZ04108.1 hypothetical protein PRCB_17690 [Pantoea rodasii]